MAWIDDRAWCHPKLVDLSDKAFRAWINGITYAAGFSTGGQLTEAQQRLVGASSRQRDELVAANLWEMNGDGVRIHDWDDHNGKRDARKAADRERKRAARLLERPQDSPRERPAERRQERRTLKEVKEVKGESSNELSRQRDVLWDALEQVLGSSPSTTSERGRWNKALKEIRDAGAQPEDVRLRAREYKRRWPDVSLTASALASNWGSLKPKSSGSPPCPQCGVGGGKHAEDCLVVAEMTPDEVATLAAGLRAHQ